MWIDVVEKRMVRHQPEGDRKASTKWFNEALVAVRLPKRNQVWNLPPLSAGPLQRRPNARPSCRQRGGSADLRPNPRHPLNAHVERTIAYLVWSGEWISKVVCMLQLRSEPVVCSSCVSGETKANTIDTGAWAFANSHQ